MDVDDDFQLNGMVAGDATVRPSGHFELLGMVTGDLQIEEGGSAVIRGMVAGDVLNAGTLIVYGMIVGRLTATSQASTEVVRGAQIHGVVH